MILSPFRKSLASLTDEEIMKRVTTKNDDRAFDELYHRHSRKLMGLLARQLGGNHERAADLTQDTFMRVWTYRERFRHEASFTTWMFAIAYNLLKNEYRHADKTTFYVDHVMQTAEEEQDDGVDTKMDNDAFDEALKKTLSMLDDESRMLFSLRFEEEMSITQISVIMNIPEGTVKSRLYRLTRILKDKLKTYEI